MRRNQKVLELLEARSKKDQTTSYRSLVRDLELTGESACDCFKRLLRERLIEPAGYRPPRYHFRLLPNESIRELRFQLTRRGRERLRHLRKERKKEEGWLW